MNNDQSVVTHFVAYLDIYSLCVVSSIVCVVLRAVLFERGVCYLCIVSYCSTTATE
jgi:hypothetical protein